MRYEDYFDTIFNYLTTFFNNNSVMKFLIYSTLSEIDKSINKNVIILNDSNCEDDKKEDDKKDEKKEDDREDDF